MMYGIECKNEYIDSWPQELKDKLQGFATVEITYPDSRSTLLSEAIHINSPLGGYSVFINKDSDQSLNDTELRTEYSFTDVYVVSEGGHIVLNGMFCCDKSSYYINLCNSKVVNKQKYAELYTRVTEILKGLKSDDFPV